MPKELNIYVPLFTLKRDHDYDKDNFFIIFFGKYDKNNLRLSDI